MAKKKSLIALIEDAIEKGATTAEDIHRAIADKPLKMLLKIDALSGPAKKIKRIQDESIGAIYDLIREINELVAKYANEMLAQAREGGRDLGKSAASMRKSVDAAVKRARKAGASAKRQVTAAVKRGPKAAAKKKPAKAAAAVKRAVKKAATATKKAPAKKAPAAKKRAVTAASAPAA